MDIPISFFPLRINEKIFLRPFEKDDHEDLFKAVDSNRAYLKQWLGWLDKNNSPSDSLEFIQSCSKGIIENKYLTLGIFQNNIIVGVIDFHKIMQYEKEAFIGYWLHKKYQGQGIISLSCSKLIDFGFQQFGLSKVSIACASRNIKSQNIPKRLGLIFEKEVKDAEFLYDHYVDHYVFTINKEEWLSRKST